MTTTCRPSSPGAAPPVSFRPPYQVPEGDAAANLHLTMAPRAFVQVLDSLNPPSRFRLADMIFDAAITGQPEIVIQ
jgi:hypothetical protein